MRLIKTTILLLFFAFTITCADNNQSGDKAPVITFSEAEYDFGIQGQDSLLKHVFVFSNEGDALLEIRKVKTS